MIITMMKTSKENGRKHVRKGRILGLLKINFIFMETYHVRY